MKSVLVSVQPKWCELIANGEKTVEVRKTIPKIDVPFKCYIYCTKGKVLNDNLWLENNGYNRLGNGKVIGEFLCDEIRTIHCQSVEKEAICAMAVGNGNKEYYDNSCVSYKEAYRYLRNVKKAYGWHISDLVIYDKPKELREFYTVCKMDCEYCEMWGSVRVNAEEFDMDCKSDWFNHKPLTRPPQSWCYVEEVE